MNDIFTDLFVLEAANQHLGSVQRGLRIIDEFAAVVHRNKVKAAIKLQFRSRDFVHKDHRHRRDVRYIRKTVDTTMNRADYMTLIDAVRGAGLIPCATPFDEASVELCSELPLIKLASSDIDDWPLIKEIAKTRKPVIASTGGASPEAIDALVTFFAALHIPLAINHCVSIYPSEDCELDLHQIDFLRARYPNVIGFSTHECTDWKSSMLIAYAKGARTFERHVDIEGPERSRYCSLPWQINRWFLAWHKAREMCGTAPRVPPAKELAYLESLRRGVYALYDLPADTTLMPSLVYYAIPLQEGQASCRNLFLGRKLLHACRKDAPVMLDAIA